MPATTIDASPEQNELITLPDPEGGPAENAKTIICLGGPRHGKKVADRGQPQHTFSAQDDLGEHLYCKDVLTLTEGTVKVSKKVLFYMGRVGERSLKF